MWRLGKDVEIYVATSATASEKRDDGQLTVDCEPHKRENSRLQSQEEEEKMTMVIDTDTVVDPRTMAGLISTDRRWLVGRSTPTDRASRRSVHISCSACCGGASAPCR